ncbi:hypothetical protein AB0O76_34150, partial [Streptomyces sp. NPDC086554]|uniref:hypothetical protein n=1 Tax=Streptomyces sp. NPDC086554 TaxID=3154864 RepID=UPI00343857F1
MPVHQGPQGRGGPQGVPLLIPRLIGAARELADDLEGFERYARERRAALLRHRNAVADSLLDDARRTASTPVSRVEASRDIAAALDAMWSALRSEMENNAGAGGENPQIAHLEIDLDFVRRLDTALRDYDAAVRAVVHPHANDPYVITLTGSSPLAAAVERATGPYCLPGKGHRESLQKLRDDTQEGVSQSDSARQEGARW